MANIERRKNQLPRKAREQRAYRLVQVGAVSGTGTIVTAVLAVFGAVGWLIPIVLAAITGLVVWSFRGVTGQR